MKIITANDGETEAPIYGHGGSRKKQDKDKAIKSVGKEDFNIAMTLS